VGQGHWRLLSFFYGHRISSRADFGKVRGGLGWTQSESRVYSGKLKCQTVVMY
jgi:hypothetical protein